MMKIFAVASDPGSANAIMPVIEYCSKKGHEIYGITSNAATATLKNFPLIKEVDDKTSIESITNMLKSNQSQIILSGAGAYNLLEHTVRCAAAKRKIPCVAVLDYWTNYNVRFKRFDGFHWISSLPNRICVLDEIVRDEMLTEGFESEQIIVTGQPYFEYISNWKTHTSSDTIKQLREFFINDKSTLLIGFCSEPILEDTTINHKHKPDYTQYDVITNTAKILETLSNSTGKKIHFVVRPHPREKKEIIEKTLNPFKKYSTFSCTVSNAGTSMEFIDSCDLIIGMKSMALIESCILKHPTLSVQLNLKHKDVFLGTTRGFCPSIYTIQNLKKLLEKWLESGSIPKRIPIRFVNSSTKQITLIMEKLIDKNI